MYRFGNSCCRARISENGARGNIVMGLLFKKKRENHCVKKVAPIP